MYDENGEYDQWENECQQTIRDRWMEQNRALNEPSKKESPHWNGGSDGKGCGCGCLVVLILIGVFLYNTALSIYGTMLINFHYPTPDDYTSDYYKMAAAEKADKYIKQIEKDTWEKKGIIALTEEDRHWVWASFRWQVLDGKYWSGYENKKVGRIMDPYRSYKHIQDEVDYPDACTYQVKVGNRVNFMATGKDGKQWKDYAKLDNTYLVTLKCEPERRFYGLMDMNWQILDVEFIDSNMSEDEVMNLTENTVCP